MAWIESHQSLLRHPKTISMMSSLSCERYKILGHLHALWWWGLDVADEEGKLPAGTTPEAIADGAGWPVEDARAFVAALRKAKFMEKRGYQFHDWPDYTWRYNSSKNNAKGNGAFGNHKRWHVDRGIFAPDCDFCRGDSPPDSQGAIASESHLPTYPPSSPTNLSNQPTEPQRIEPTRLAAKDHPLNLTNAEWQEVISKFPGLNQQARWREWVCWIEEGGEKRRPDNKMAAFVGWLKKSSVAVEAAAGKRV